MILRKHLIILAVLLLAGFVLGAVLLAVAIWSVVYSYYVYRRLGRAGGIP